jgi:hypothetical protein
MLVYKIHDRLSLSTILTPYTASYSRPHHGPTTPITMANTKLFMCALFLGCLAISASAGRSLTGTPKGE